MKKLLVLVSLLAVGLLVGCGSEKPKPAVDPAAKMKEMQEKTGGMVDEAKKNMDKVDEVREGAVKEGAEAVKEGAEAVKEGAEKVEGAVKEGAEAVKEGAEKAEGAVKEAAKEDK